MMKPILFNTEIVKAIVDGRKTVTRRVIKQQYPLINKHPTMDKFFGFIGENVMEIKPMCNVGDIFYVREKWQISLNPITDDPEYIYFENMLREDVIYTDLDGEELKWKPSIHMPKEAARILLKVTSVKVERLKDITEEQVEKEGIGKNDFFYISDRCPRKRFIKLWNSTIKKQDIEKYGWEANPFVWVIEFERCEKPKGEKQC